MEARRRAGLLLVSGRLWLICVDWVTSAAGPLCPPIFAVKADIADGQLGHNRTSGITLDCEICFRDKLPSRDGVGDRRGRSQCANDHLRLALI